MRQKRRIREFTRTPKEFRVWRKYIDKGGLVPQVLCDTNGMYWDGFSALDGNGQIVCLSGSSKKQMINMILDGFYGEEIKDAFMDDKSYWKIRDALINWPDQEKILKEGLRVLQITRKG